MSFFTRIFNQANIDAFVTQKNNSINALITQFRYSTNALIDGAIASMI
jgi:hypothetical protein